MSEMPGAESLMNTNDRRSNRRFPLRLAVKFRALGSKTAVAAWALGETIDISSNGLLFTTPESPPPKGQAVEVFIAWPVFLDNRIPLKLVIKGPVVRNAAGKTAMRFETYEFRTSPRI